MPWLTARNLALFVVVQDVLIAVTYLWHGDWRLFWYWLSAASITLSVTL